MIRTLLVAGLVGLAVPAFADERQDEPFYCGETFINLPLSGLSMMATFRKSSVNWLELTKQDGTSKAIISFYPNEEETGYRRIRFPFSLYLDVVACLD